MYKTTLSIVLILLFCSGIVVLTVFYHSYDATKWPDDFAIVVDAGSSGTRTYLYKWKAYLSAAKGDDLVVIENSNCKLYDNGIDKLKNKEEFVQKITPCLDKLKKLIPQDRMSRTYIFLAATAGMRLLEARNKTASDEILDFIREYFKETDFLFKNNTQVRILNGQEEGTNAWISANYYKNNFKNQDSDSDSVKVCNTTGILDLGGASTQIVYVPEKPNLNHKSYFDEIRIYGVDYKPYSQSFLCWGQNEIALLYQTYLISKNNYHLKGSSNCYPANFIKTVDSQKLIQSPCANGILTNKNLEFTKGAENILKDSTYKFEGQSDFEQCKLEVSNLFPTSNCKYESCSFDGVYMPPLDKDNIMGFSGFYYAFKNTEKLFQLKLVNNLELFKSKTIEICSMNHDQLEKLNRESGANLPINFVTNQCFSNVFVLSIFESYGISSLENIQITSKVNGYKLNWALGYLINELNRDDFLPYEKLPRKLKFELYLPLTLIACFGIIITMSVLIHFKLKKRRRELKKIDEPNENHLLEDAKI